MVKTVLSLLLCIAPLLSIAQQDTIRRADGGGRIFMQINSDGILAEEGYTQNGLIDGIWTTYQPWGYPKSITSYKNGKKNGMRIETNGMGGVAMLENYKDDLLEGPTRIYSREAREMEVIFYSKGKRHGMYKKNYEDGKPQELANYNYDKRDGKSIWYGPSGHPAVQYEFRNDVKEGESAIYFGDGTVKEQGSYSNDLQTGLWKEFYENGNLKAEGKYEKGEKTGEWKEYDEAGKYLKTVKYKQGKTRK